MKLTPGRLARKVISRFRHAYLKLTDGFVEKSARRAVDSDWRAFVRDWSDGRLRPSDSAPIISLTSYPPRFPTLALTLKSLLMQSTKPRAVVLWIAHADMEKLPAEVVELRQYGLRIEACDDLKSYKKLLPALKAYSGFHIAVCDDDTYYWRTWLATLCTEIGKDPKTIHCLRAHKILTDKGGNILPYAEWIYEAKTEETSPFLFPTGVGGVLYPAGIFDQRVMDERLFMTICPTADDIWFFWLASLAGAKFKLLRHSYRYVSWANSQQQSLWRSNTRGESANDRQIEALVAHFGLPWVTGVGSSCPSTSVHAETQAKLDHR
jgi:hypothetical protein